MGCCLSKTPPPQPSSSPPPPPVNGSCSVKSPHPNKSEPLKLEAQEKNLKVEEPKPKNEEKEEVEIQENNKPRKEVFVIKHRRSHEKSSKTTTTTDPEDSSVSDVKSTGSNQNNPVDVDAILIQCGRLSRSNSAAAKTRRYSGSKRSFDFDQSERSRDGGDADAEDGGEEEEAERRIHRQRHRGGESPRERRRRTPSRERDDSKSYRSGSRERGSGNGGGGGGGGSRRVSRSPGRRSEINPNPNSSGNSVNSSNSNRPGKFVSVPATDKALSSNNGGEGSVKRVTVKRNVGKAASPRSQSPARAASQPSPSKLSRKTEHSPYRRNPLGEIDTNSVAFPLSQGNTNCNKRMMNKDSDLNKESVNFVAQKMNTKTATQAPIRRSASPSRVIKEQHETLEECKIMLSSGTELVKPPQIMSRSRSLRKSRDFDFSPDALLLSSNNIDNNNVNSNNATAGSTLPSYTALLLEDIQNFHQKSVNVNALSSSMSKACSIVEAVADLNSTTNQHQRTELSFTPGEAKKADLMEPSFEKYVTVKRGGSSLEDMEEQESSGSNSFTGSSCVVQRQGYSSSSSREPNSVESTDRMSMRSSNKQERDRSPLGVSFEKQEFDPLKKNGAGVGRKRVAVADSSSSGKGVLQATTTSAAAVSM